MSYQSEILADNPVGYWRLGETSGTVANDETANNLDGTYVNTPTLGVAGAVSGNTAVTLTAASLEYINVPDNNLLDFTGSLSLELWFKRNTIGASMRLIAKGSAYFIFLAPDNIIAFSISASSAAHSAAAQTDTTSWHHLVCTKTSGVADGKVYIDGVNVTGDSLTSGNPTANTDPLRIGSASPTAGSYWDGSVDEVAIYTSVLSAVRVLAHYNAAAPAALDQVGMVGI